VLSENDRANLALRLIAGLFSFQYVSWITDKDFDALKERGINTVRLPVSPLLPSPHTSLTDRVSTSSSVTLCRQVGYWTVGKANCNCEDSKFWPYIDKYEGQWSYVLKAIDWANQRGMGVLIDLHGAQG
jgi:aryl-phospho-beta-D-glucosidase BglC (GH1 family)